MKCSRAIYLPADFVIQLANAIQALRQWDEEASEDGRTYLASESRVTISTDDDPSIAACIERDGDFWLVKVTDEYEESLD